MADRKADIHRKTTETDVTLKINLDGVGKYEIDTGIGFFDHMLTHLSKHGRIDLVVNAKGDLNVDAHHTVEDIAICLGQALLKALGDKKGIARYGHSSVPMEETLANVSVDLSGRSSCIYNVDYRTDKIGDFDVEWIEEHDHEYRTGVGTDIHRLVEGRKLMLGGVLVPYPAGLLGHSDGDVAMHAIVDALLGAAGLGDIGMLFPDTDVQWKDADSKVFLYTVKEQLDKKGWEGVNVDLTIHAEAPKPGPLTGQHPR